MSLKQRKKAYEVLVLFHDEKLNDQGVLLEINTSILVQDKIVLAANDHDALFMANRLVPEDYTKRPDQLEIRLRVF
jgi:hypothetical protein